MKDLSQEITTSIKNSNKINRTKKLKKNWNGKRNY